MADTLYDRLLAIRKQQLGQDEESNSRSEEALHSYLDNARKQRENQILAEESAERGRQRVEAQRAQEWLQNRTPSTPLQVAQGQIYAGDYAHGNLPQVSAAQAWKNKYSTSAQDTMQRTDLTPEQRMIATENKYASMIPAPTLPENPTDEQKTAYTRQVFARDALVKNAAQTTRKNDILNKSTPQYQEKQSEEERLAQSRLDLGQYEIEGLKDLKSRYQGQLRTYRGLTAENANGRLSPQETMAQIRDIDERIAQKTKDYAAQQKSLNNQITERKLYPYLALQYNSDFAEKSKANPNVTDRDYLRINSPDRYRLEVDYEPLYALTKDYLEQLTDEQKGIYNYVYNTQGAEEAQKYIDVLQPVLESKANTASLQRAQEFGKEHPILANAATVLMSPLRGAGAVGEALNQALGNPVRENAIYNRPNTMISGARAGSDSRLRDAVSGQLDKTGASEGVKSWITDAMSALNQGTLSSLDSAWAGLLGQNIASSMFGGLGFQDARSILKAAEANPNLVSSGMISQDLLTKAKRVSKFAEESTRIMMGMQTVPDAIVNAKKRGLTDDQAFQLGMLSGAFEWATEKFSIENLFNTEWTGNTLREFLKKNATQRAFEGSEEISSGLLNTIADVLIAGDKSEWRQSISEYKRLNPGMSDNEAFARALWDKTVEIGGEGLVAFLTTGNEIAVQLAEQEVYNAKTNKVHGVVTNSDKKNNTSNAQTIDNIIAEAINKSDADAASDLADVSNIMKSAYPKGSTINRTIDYIRETARRSPTATEAMRYEGLADYMEQNKESISKLANSRYNGENIAVETEGQTAQETTPETVAEPEVETQGVNTTTESTQNAPRTAQNATNALTAGENTTVENAVQNTATEGSDTRNGRQTFLDSMGLSEESTVEDAARQLYRDINANPDNYVVNKGLRNPGAVTDRRGLVNSIAAKQVDMLNAMRNSGEYTAAQIQEATETAQAIDKELRSITQGNVESGVRALNAMFRKAGLDVDVVVDPSEATNYETGNLADRAYYDPSDGKVHVSGYMDTNSALMGVVAHEIFHKAANGTVRKQLVNDVLKAKAAIIASNDKSDRYGISKATHSAVLNTGVGDFVDTYSDKLMNTFGLTAEGQTAVQNRMNEQGMSLGEAMKSLANENEKSFWSMFNTSSEGTAQDYIEEEMAAHFIEQLGSQNGEAIMRELIRDNRSLLEKIIDAIKSVFNKNPNVQNSATYKRIINAYERIAAEESGQQVQKISGTSNETMSEDTIMESGDGAEIKRYGVDSSLEPLGLKFQKDNNGKTVLIDDSENPVTKITEQMVWDSDYGALIQADTISEDNPNGILTPKEAEQEVKFLTDMVQLMLDTQDVDLIWAVNSTIGFNPAEPGTRSKDSFDPKTSRFAALTSNSDPQYGTTIDFTTICGKTQAVIDAMSKLMKKTRQGLTQDEIIQIVYDETAYAEEPVPCPVCYVFARWVGLGGLFDTMYQLQEQYPPDMDESKIRADVAKLEEQIKTFGGKKFGEQKEKFISDLTKRQKELDSKRIRHEVSGTPALTAEEQKELDTLNEQIAILNKWTWFTDVRLQPDYKKHGYVDPDVLFDINAGKRFADEFPLAWAYRTSRGPAMGKAASPYSAEHLGQIITGIATPSAVDKHTLGDLSTDPFYQMGGELTDDAKDTLETAKKNARAQNLLNGQRLQSTSDFRFEYALDYMMAFFELQCAEAKAQMYTKVPEMVTMAAMCGVETNLSLMPLRDGYDENGNLIFSDVTGMHPDDAFYFSQKYNNVQPIIVGINHRHIRLCMADPRLSFIIPFHASGGSEGRYVSMMKSVGEEVKGRVDYSNYQEEIKDENATAEQKSAFDARTKILIGKASSLTDAERNAVRNNPWLSQLHIRFYGTDVDGNEAKVDPKYLNKADKKSGRDSETYQNFMSAEQAKKIMPYEFWDKTVSISPISYDKNGNLIYGTDENAKANGNEFIKYCESLGLHPRFSGWSADGYNKEFDFTNEAGYWKTIPDRKMYNIDGTYHEQEAVKINNFSTDYLLKENADRNITKPSAQNDPRKTDEIVARSERRIQALRDAKAAFEDEVSLGEQNKAKQFETLQNLNNTGNNLFNSANEILNYGEAIADYEDGEDIAPDYKAEAVRKAMETGKIRVYSASPIEPGTVVTPSRAEAKSEAGKGGKVSSKMAKLSDIAWADAMEGQYAPIAKEDSGKPKSKNKTKSSREVTPEMDEEYMAAVDANDEAKENRMVEQAARAAGYDSPKLFHGTDAFGFTEIDNTAPGADGFSFWAASRADMSGTYTQYAKTRKIASEISDEEYVSELDKLDSDIEDALYNFKRLIDRTFSEWYFGQGDAGLRERFDDANPEAGYGDGIYDEFSDIIYDAFYQYRDELDTELEADEWLDETEDGKALMEAVLDLEALRRKVSELENGINGGIYELYANTDNMYELDAKGSLWKELRPEGLPDIGRPYKTRDVANWARDNGYDGVIFRNIYDNGRYGRTAPGDVYAFFHPQAQVKSADPVTYDENGDPIPLSERFNPNNTDIRFSRAVTAEEDAEYMEAVESGDMDKAAQMVMADAKRSGYENAIPEQASAYTLRTKAAPKKTVKVYKVFTVAPDGSPTALFVSSATKLPQNVWLEAVDTWHFTADNGQQYIPSTKNPYTKGGKTGASVPIPNEEIRQELIKRGYLPKNSKAKNITALAYRPGWHAGDLPFFPQGGMEGNPRYTNQGKKNKEFDPSKPETNYENIHRYNQVVFECEMAADTDYTATAQAQEKAKNKNGTVNQRKADLQYLPADGYYKYTTNPTMKDVGNWLISGSLKINRALTQEECDTILAQHGYKPQEWEGGTLDLEKLGYTGEQYDAARKTLAPVTYDDDGNVIPLSQRFNPDVDDVRRSREVKSDDFAVELEREKTELLRAQMVANTALGDGKAINQTAAEDIRSRYKDLFGDMIPDEEINRDLMGLWNILHRPKRGKEDTAESRLNEARTYAEGVARKWLDETSYENVLKDSIGDEETLKGLQSLYNHLTARRNADSEGYYYIIPDMITAAGSRDAFNEIRKTLNGVKLKGFATKAEAEASGRKSISDLFTELRSDGGEYNSLFTPDETANDFSKLTQIASNYALASEAEQDPYKQIYTGAGVDNTAKVYELANDLLYSWETRANPTAAAKAEQKLREERAKGQERLKQVRERRDELIEEEKQKGQDRLDKEKARGEKRLNEEREKAQRRADRVKQNTEKREAAMNERFEATYERMRRSYERDKAKAEAKFDRYVQKVKAKDLRIAERALRGKIAKQLTKINQWLEKPEKKRGKHIPQSLRAPMAKLLEAFGGMKMKNGKQISAERMRQIQAEEMSGTRQFVDDVIQGLKGMGGEDGKNSLVTEMFIQRLSEIANEISTAKMTPISNETALSTEVKTDNEEQADVYYQYLNNVKELLDMAIHAIRDENNVIMNNRAMQLDDLKKELALDIRDRTDRKIKADTPSGSEMLGDILKMGRYGSLSADLMFQLMGDSWYNKIAESFREGQNRQAQHEADYAEFMKELTKFYDIEKSGFYGDFVPVEKNDEQNDQGWLGEVYTVPVKGSDGNTINATRGQIMTLYALWNRPDARRHLENGGACFTNHNGEDYKENTVKNIDQAKFEEITSVLTDEEKKIADGIVNYMSDTVADWGNDVSLYVYGYRLFNEDHYFPMEVADYSLKKTNLDPDREASPLNPSFTKSTTKSIKPLALGNIFEVADNHVRGMSIYNAYGAACNDLDRIINDSEMNQLIRKKLGNGALVYLKDFIQTTGGTKLRTAEDAWASALRRGARFRMNNYKRQAVSFNLSTAVKQGLSAIRAANVIDPKYLASGVLAPGSQQYKAVRDKMQANSGVGYIKSLGYSDTGFGKTIHQLYDPSYINDSGIIRGSLASKEAGRKAIRAYDKLTDSGMFLASKMDEWTWVNLWNAATKEVTEQNPNLSQKELDAKIAARFNEIIGKTQVVDTALDTAPIMRNRLLQFILPFMNEPTKSAGNLIVAADAFANKKPGSKKQFAKVIGTTVLANMILEPIISALFSMWRDEKDDIGNGFWETFAEKLFGIKDGKTTFKDFVTSGVFGGMWQYPVIQGIYDIIANTLQDYDNTTIDSAAISDTVKAIDNLYQNSGKDPATRTKNQGRLWRDLFETLAADVGIPAKTLRRQFSGAARLLMNTVGSNNLKWEYNKLSYNLENSNARSQKGFYDILARAYKDGDIESYQRMLKELTDIINVSEKSGNPTLINLNTVKDNIEKRGGEIKPGTDLWNTTVQAAFRLDQPVKGWKVENFITKTYVNAEKDGIKDSEADNVMLSMPDSYTYGDENGDDVKMTPAQYDEFTRDVGSLSYKILSELSAPANSKAWNSLTVDQQIYAIDKAYAYSKAKCKSDINPDYSNTQIGKPLMNCMAENASPKAIADAIMGMAENTTTTYDRKKK